jgi:hypothetical protein
LSDPSIEFWFLLHYTDTTAWFNDANDVTKRLRKHQPSYNKHPDMAALIPLVPDALANAEKVRKNHTKQGNPSPRTDLDLLVIEMNSQAKQGNELFPAQSVDFENLSMHTKFSH